MLDIKLIRDKPDWVKQKLTLVGCPPGDVQAVLDLDEQRRGILAEVENARAERRRESKKIGAMAPGAEQESAKVSVRLIGDRIGAGDEKLTDIEERLQLAMLSLPNIPHDDVPEGPDDSANVVVRSVGEAPSLAFEPKPHWEIGEALGIIDFERGVKISGTRFYLLKGDGARLQRALIAWMLDLHTREHGHSEVYPPAMVREECLYGTGNLPKFGENLYRDAEEDFYFIPTAEVPVTNMYREEILDAGQLPIRHVAYTPCFRREKMSAGRDVRGIKRGHQFDKVEMVRFVHPDESDAELLRLLDDAEDVSRRLGIPHRVVQMCTGDLSFVSAMKYDVEMWAVGCKEWLEVSSCSNFRDFQARRAQIRFREGAKDKPRFVHTLNGSGLALPRVMIAILENYQHEDGSVEIPEVLRPYMGGQSKIG